MASERMTRAKALQVLIQESAKAVSGTGTGIREEVTQARLNRVAAAVRRLYREAYGFDCDYFALSNLGLASAVSREES